MGGLPGAITDAIRRFRTSGIGALREFSARTYLRYARRLTPDPIFEADWDLLIVLDACRADVWAEVAAERDNTPIGTTRTSPASTSTEWLSAVFGNREASDLAEVGYVTANPYSAEHVPSAHLGCIEEVWRSSWDDELGIVPPRPVTDAAIRIGRVADLDRVIVHYMQPNFPSLADDLAGGTTLDRFGEESLDVWDDLRSGHRSAAEIWQAYKENLKIVQADVSLLCSNFDAETAIVTADHGNAFGELGIYGHAPGLALNSLRKVPWVEMSATDRRTYEPPAAPDRTE